MAYPISPGAVAEVTVEGTYNGQLFMSLFHYRLLNGSTIPDGAATITALINWFAGPSDNLLFYLGCLTNEIDDIQVYGQWITPFRYRYLPQAGGPYTGTGGALGYPQNVSAALTKFGEAANRKNIGTLHMPGVVTTFIAGGEITPLGFGAYDGMCAALVTTFVAPGGGEMIPVIFNRSSPATSPRIVGAFTQPTSRTNRRRTVGVGA